MCVAEEGVFLALDLGGTNFRVLLLELRAGRLAREDVKQYHIRCAPSPPHTPPDTTRPSVTR